MSSKHPNLQHVDWSTIPAPVNDGACAHLVGSTLPCVALPATDGQSYDVSALSGRTVVFAYPRTGVPGEPSLVDDWDMIPGARGCTPQTCAFRDLYADLRAAGADAVFGLSTQTTEFQSAMVARLTVPFPVLSDAGLRLTEALRLPTLDVAGQTLIKRLSLIIDNGVVSAVQYPVFPPDTNAADVLDWLRANPKP